jgi:antitoxin ChpS
MNTTKLPQVGTLAGMDAEGDRLVLQRQEKPRYTLEELLRHCDTEAPVSGEDRQWIDLRSVGDEF